jgi:hypothetical protein
MDKEKKNEGKKMIVLLVKGENDTHLVERDNKDWRRIICHFQHLLRKRRKRVIAKRQPR